MVESLVKAIYPHIQILDLCLNLLFPMHSFKTAFQLNGSYIRFFTGILMALSS
jgi:hypothetical protein